MARKRKRKPHGQGCTYKRGKGNWWIAWREGGKRSTSYPCRACTCKGNWWIAWREGGKRRRKGGYPTEDEANDVLARITADVRAGRDGMPVAAKDVPELGELAEAWIARRELTHRSADEDHWRWHKHLAPWFGKRLLTEIDPALLREFIEAKLAEKLSSTTVRLLVLEMSGLFSDLVERELVPHNPVRLLPRSTRRLIRAAHDPRTTPDRKSVV